VIRTERPLDRVEAETLTTECRGKRRNHPRDTHDGIQAIASHSVERCDSFGTGRINLRLPPVPRRQRRDLLGGTGVTASPSVACRRRRYAVRCDSLVPEM
jgi:hypothetical protein